MLDADSRRVRGRLRHIAATALAILALASLGGCGGGAGNPSSSSSGGSWLSGTTKWFGGSKTIAVAPIVGAPPSVAKDLSQALVTAGKDRNLTIVPSGSGEANYAMRGYLLANNESGGTKVSYVWDVSDAKGARVVRISGEEMIKGRSGGDPWKKVDAAATRAIAGKTTSQLAASLDAADVRPHRLPLLPKRARRRRRRRQRQPRRPRRPRRLAPPRPSARATQACSSFPSRALRATASALSQWP